MKITTNYHELSPAYARDYNSATAVEAAFRQGKDFQGDIGLGFKYVSINDFHHGLKVLLRYKKHTKVAIVTV